MSPLFVRLFSVRFILCVLFSLCFLSSMRLVQATSYSSDLTRGPDVNQGNNIAEGKIKMKEPKDATPPQHKNLLRQTARQKSVEISAWIEDAETIADRHAISDTESPDELSESPDELLRKPRRTLMLQRRTLMLKSCKKSCLLCESFHHKTKDLDSIGLFDKEFLMKLEQRASLRKKLRMEKIYHFSKLASRNCGSSNGSSKEEAITNYMEWMQAKSFRLGRCPLVCIAEEGTVGTVVSV